MLGGSADEPVSLVDEVAERSLASRRDRLLERATRVVDATVALISELGDQFTVEDVVKRSGVSRRSVRSMFADREELMLAALERTTEGRLERQREVFDAHAGDPVAQLRETLRVRWSWFDGEPMTLSRVRAVVYPGLRPRWPGAHAQSKQTAMSSIKAPIAELRAAGRLNVDRLNDDELADLLNTLFRNHLVERVLSAPLEQRELPADEDGFEQVWDVLSRLLIR